MFNKETMQELKEKYTEGTVVQLVHMDDVQAPPSGTKGVVQYVDDIGQIHVAWENGSSLALCAEIDEFAVVLDR